MSAFGADSAPKFPLGRILLTSAVRLALSNDEIDFALLRHQTGDWGDLDDEDLARNERAVLTEGRLVSVYSSASYERFYVITEADRSVTTVLFPHEY